MLKKPCQKRANIAEDTANDIDKNLSSGIKGAGALVLAGPRIDAAAPHHPNNAAG